MKNNKLTIFILAITLFTVIIFITVILLSVFNNKFHEVNINLNKNYVDFINEQEFNSKGHVSMLTQYNTDATVGYLNKDGTKTLYVFSAPIHFMESNGELQNIDTRIANVKDATLRKKGYVYTIASNDIQPYYPASLKTGILLKGLYSYSFGINIDKNIYGNYIDKKNIIDKDTKMIEYKNAFSNNSKLDFYPSSLGTNCEIQLDKQPLSNQYNFWLDAPNCSVTLDKGGYILMTTDNIVDAGLGNETKEIVAIIQPPLLKDSSGNVSYKSTLSLNQVSDGKYNITLILDEQFINSSNTKYPVKSYSTFEIRRKKQPNSQTYSGMPNLNSYLSNYVVIGNSPNFGIGQERIRYVFTKALNLKSSDIISSTYSLYNFSNKNTKDNYEMLTILDDWCSLVTHWGDNVNYGNRTSYLATTNNPVLNFDITSEIKKWCDDPDGIEEHKGLLLKSVNEEEGVWNVILNNNNALYNNRTEVIIR